MTSTPSRVPRVPVPAELRAALARLDVELGRRRALVVAGCSLAIFKELVSPGGMAQPSIIERVAAAVAPHLEVA